MIFSGERGGKLIEVGLHASGNGEARIGHEADVQRGRCHYSPGREGRNKILREME
jgi:hypothetical protein